MFTALFMFIAIAVILANLVINMATIRRAREAQLTTVDIAGQVVGADLAGTAVSDITVPKGSKEIWKASVNYGDDGSSLGSGIGFLVITGDGLVDSPQHIICGSGGAEDVDAKHSFNKAMTLGPLGIHVKELEDITATFIMVGEDVGTMSLSAELVFSDKTHGPRMKWKGQEVQLTAIDSDTQFENIGTGTAGTLKVPGQSVLIHAKMTAWGHDFGALGSGSAFLKATGNGVINDQDIALGGGGGEVVVSAGDSDTPNFEDDCDIPVRGGEVIRTDGRMVGEDVGTATVAFSLGFVMKG